MKSRVEASFSLTKTAWKSWEWLADELDMNETDVLNPFIKNTTWLDQVDMQLPRHHRKNSGKNIRRSRTMSKVVIEYLSEIAEYHSVSRSLVLEVFIQSVINGVREFQVLEKKLNKIPFDTIGRTCKVLRDILELMEETGVIFVWLPIDEISEVLDKLESLFADLENQELIELDFLSRG